MKTAQHCFTKLSLTCLAVEQMPLRAEITHSLVVFSFCGQSTCNSLAVGRKDMRVCMQVVNMLSCQIQTDVLMKMKNGKSPLLLLIICLLSIFWGVKGKGKGKDLVGYGENVVDTV